jgi:hypothetical protein
MSKRRRASVAKTAGTPEPKFAEPPKPRTKRRAAKKTPTTPKAIQNMTAKERDEAAKRFAQGVRPPSWVRKLAILARDADGAAPDDPATIAFRNVATPDAIEALASLTLLLERHCCDLSMRRGGLFDVCEAATPLNEGSPNRLDKWIENFRMRGRP